MHENYENMRKNFENFVSKISTLVEGGSRSGTTEEVGTEFGRLFLRWCARASRCLANRTRGMIPVVRWAQGCWSHRNKWCQVLEVFTINQWNEGLWLWMENLCKDCMGCVLQRVKIGKTWTTLSSELCSQCCHRKVYLRKRARHLRSHGAESGNQRRKFWTWKCQLRSGHIWQSEFFRDFLLSPTMFARSTKNVSRKSLKNNCSNLFFPLRETLKFDRWIDHSGGGKMFRHETKIWV